MTSINLRSIKALKQRKFVKAAGFTMIELMVVTAVAGVLGAVAAPKFLGAKNIAEAKALVSEAVGLAKECSVYASTDGDALASAPNSSGGATVTCDADTGGSVSSASFKALPVGYTGLKCLNTVSTGGETQAVITIGGDGAATCSLS